LERNEPLLQKTPYTFDVSVGEFLWPLFVDARLIVAGPGVHREPSVLGSLASRERVPALHCVPSLLEAAIEQAEPCGSSALRRVLCSGEALSSSLASRFFERSKAELHNLYGPTEAAIDVTWERCEGSRPVTIGRPIANVSTYVLDAHMDLAPVGVAG